MLEIAKSRYTTSTALLSSSFSYTSSKNSSKLVRHDLPFATCEAMLTIVDNVVFCQVIRHIILDNSLHYFTHYACQTNQSVIPWLTPISLLVNRDNVSITP